MAHYHITKQGLAELKSYQEEATRRGLNLETLEDAEQLWDSIPQNVQKMCQEEAAKLGNCTGPRIGANYIQSLLKTAKRDVDRFRQ